MPTNPTECGTCGLEICKGNTNPYCAAHFEDGEKICCHGHSVTPQQGHIDQAAEISGEGCKCHLMMPNTGRCSVCTSIAQALADRDARHRAELGEVVKAVEEHEFSEEEWSDFYDESDANEVVDSVQGKLETAAKSKVDEIINRT